MFTMYTLHCRACSANCQFAFCSLDSVQLIPSNENHQIEYQPVTAIQHPWYSIQPPSFGHIIAMTFLNRLLSIFLQF